jgi:hypothetical protein
MNELAMNLAAERVDNGYLEIFVVSQAISVKMLGEYAAVCDRVGIVLKSSPNRSRSGTPSFISKKYFCIASTLVCVGRQPVLVPEQDA